EAHLDKTVQADVDELLPRTAVGLAESLANRRVLARENVELGQDAELGGAFATQAPHLERGAANPLDRPAWLFERASPPRFDDRAAARENLDQKLFFVLEVVVDRAFAEAGDARDVLDARRRDAALGKHGDRRVEHTRLAVFALPIRRGAHHSNSDFDL